MKTVWIRHRGLYAVAFVVFFALCSVVVHPSGLVKRAESRAVLADGLYVPPDIAPLLRRACMDCHSNKTVWPWYSYVAPVSWLVERDVQRGRGHLNFSAWDQYTLKQREKILAEVASAVMNREMPLPQYALIHPNARLSQTDAKALYGWARLERRKIKELLGTAPIKSGDRTGNR